MKAPRRKIRVQLLKKQNEFRKLRTKWAAARGGVGSGKTTGATWWLFERIETYPKASHFVVGADYEQLRRGFFQTLLGIFEEVMEWQAGTDFRYRETPSPMITIIKSGARIRSLSAEQAERIRSVEMQTLYCEEPPTWKNGEGEGIYRVLTGRLRHSQRSGRLYPDMQPQGRMTFNPTLVGSWLYSLIEELWTKEGWPCLQFSLRDNVLLQGKDEYVRQLEALYPVERWPVEIDGEWARLGLSFFELRWLLVDDAPVPTPTRCDAVFAVIDTAIKTGVEHNSTAVAWYSYNSLTKPISTLILDWDLVQIEGADQAAWLPSVHARGEELARQCGARRGYAGAMIEDKATGTVLIQQSQNQAQREGKRSLAHAIDSKLTAMGKEERAIAAAPYVIAGSVKFTQAAFEKTKVHKGKSANHFISQVTEFRLGSKQKDGLDLLDVFCYGVLITCGTNAGERKGI